MRRFFVDVAVVFFGFALVVIGLAVALAVAEAFGSRPTPVDEPISAEAETSITFEVAPVARSAP